MKIYLVSVSGGKDSTATVVYMLKRRKKSELVFNYFDTGWEHPSVYEYLDYLERRLDIKINRIGGKTFEDICEENEYIPNLTAKFCSRILKHEKGQAIVRKYKDMGYKVYVVTGVRREESKARENYTIRNYDNEGKVHIIQPIVYWTTQQVFDYLKENGIEINPLYKKGWSRVGCYPCIFARQSEIGMLEDWAIERVKNLENKISKIKGEKVTFYREEIDDKVKRSKSYDPLGITEGFCTNLYGQCE